MCTEELQYAVTAGGSLQDKIIYYLCDNPQFSDGEGCMFKGKICIIFPSNNNPDGNQGVITEMQ